MRKWYSWSVGIGLALAAAFLLAACAPQPTPEALVGEPAEEETEEPAEEPTEEPAMEVTNAVEVMDQDLGEGNTVIVPSVTSDTAGWMVIHAAGDGGPGPVIGHAPVEAGENTDVTVELDPAGVTDTLYAMLHVDAGTEGEYEFPGDDAPAVDADGNVVVSPFVVTMMTANAVETMDQPLGEGNTITVPSVSSEVAGWMVIHAAGDGGPGPVIGHAPVTAGENTDVTVEIDPAGMTGTLFAMLHVDAGTEGEYEFPGDDVPARDAEDNIVVVPFALTGNAVGVSDQPLVDGGTVTVSSVLSEGPGWMVIHADNDGAPGPVIGHAPVEAGYNAGVPVEIDGSAATDTLYAMLHVDAGTEGEYEFPGDDTPAMDAAGNVVTPAFSLTDAAVEVMDQAPGEGNTVVVPLVAAETAGWLVVHAEGDGGPGPVIGHTQVDGGINRNVEVELDAEGLTETVYAMLHVDAGEAGTYEFPGPDAPARDDEDNVVVLPFALEGVTMSEEMSDEAMMGDATIAVGDGSYSPGTLTVTAGTTVTWQYNGSGGHTVTADDGSFDSGNLSGGDTFSFTFDEPGEYPYYCTYHGGPGGQGMSGIVIVTES